ncbi:MAG: nucleotide exchange factor GrpE [Xanthobacteraceae bacterium]|nr:nucleotide exchange factor GrpE [Xanthobacteraceae bacterium]MBX3523583.1 nucleotide exchange factor GrpE [Xanthobacteraceae bacterium]MBX3534902.1 nucleotide exchange factor GrpE [Xanthobacteraceae bacterium]MBX3549559.1 nucleotide exchange factor GrpE [Xanthobacteraceae bacterium]MCW5673253.1 nucleotide exchange factor GrpE [Xanthobacteraceae bacterium]
MTADENAKDKAPLDPQAANENQAREGKEHAAYVDERTVLEAQVAELKDKYLRAHAEMENTRRRAEKDVADARNFSIAGFARDMLSVADNLGRALAAVDPAIRDAADNTLKTLLEGVELTNRELAKTLEKHGVRLLDPVGQKFDPNFHQAMFEIPDDSVPAGTVKQVVQPGYAIGERVLRPAMVGVAKAAPKAGPANGGDVDKSV